MKYTIRNLEELSNLITILDLKTAASIQEICRRLIMDCYDNNRDGCEIEISRQLIGDSYVINPCMMAKQIGSTGYKFKSATFSTVLKLSVC